MQHDFILLDRSGSMAVNGRWDEALAGINAYVKKLADANVDTGVTLIAFDKDGGNLRFETLRDRITPKTWKDVSNDDAKPRGWTPLFDAVGRMVAKANEGFNGTQYSKVAMIIVTDGENNASREFSQHQAKALLNECRAKGWQVVMLGADFENAAQAASLDNSIGATMAYAAGQSVNSMRMTASKRATFGATGQSIAFSDHEKASVKTTKG